MDLHKHKSNNNKYHIYEVFILSTTYGFIIFLLLIDYIIFILC